MTTRLASILLALAAAPALAHEEGAFASAGAHEMAHAHAFGGAAGLPGGALAVLALGFGVALAASPTLRAGVLARVRGALSRRR